MIGEKLRRGGIMSALSKNLTALSGEYFVAGHLCMNGIVASLTLKNYPGVDIFAYNPANGKHTAVQVKTTRVARSSGYWISDPDKIKGEGTPFVFVHLSKKLPPEFYVVGASALAKLIKRESDYWYVTLKNLEAYKDQWGNLGLD
jgi:hypothetical protein